MNVFITFITLAIATVNAFPQYNHAVSHSTFSLAQGSNQGGRRNSQFTNYGSTSFEQKGHYYVDYQAHPKYEFEYGVEDKHTGDIKSQHEERDGDNTKGYYTVQEPDGTILTVHYTVDKHSGFQAVVERKGHAAHPQVVKKVAAVAPIVNHYNHY